MTSSRDEDARDQALLAFLAAQRGAALSIVAGMGAWLAISLRGVKRCRPG